MSALWLLAENRTGDPDTWPEAVAYVGLALCALAAFYVWCRWGRDGGDS